MKGYTKQNYLPAVRVYDNLRLKLERLAKQDKRKLADYIRVTMERHVTEKGAR